MKHYVDSVINTLGVALVGVSVRVNISGGGLATIYSDDGVTTTANPLTTDSNGMYGFYVADGRYDLIFSGTGIVTKTISDVEIADITQAAGSDAAWTTDILQSGSANPAASGLIRLASGDAIKWRNAGNSADIALSKNGSDQFSFGSLVLPAVADTIVARATTDTLTNKTLNGGLNSITLLNVQGPQAGITGSVAETTMFSWAMPAGTMQAGKGIRVKVAWIKSANANATTLKTYLNAAGTAFRSNSFTDNAFDWEVYDIFNNSGVQNAQTILVSAFVNNIPGGTVVTDTQVTSGALTIKSTITLGNAGDTVTPKFFLVELLS